MTPGADVRSEDVIAAEHPDWPAARPSVVPRPTFWPAGTAFGIAFLFWGIVTSPVVAAAGGLVLVVSLIGWIGEMRHEPEG